MTQEQRILAQIRQCDCEIAWLTEMMEANRLISVALRSGSLEQRSRAMAFAQRVLREGRQ